MMKDKMTAKEFRETFANKTSDLFKAPATSRNIDRLVILNPSVHNEGALNLFIGIDPGTKTGFAVWNIKDKKFIQIKTITIHNALFMTHNYHKHHNIKVIVEDARARKWFGGNSESKEQGAGSIKRDCSIWEAFLTDYKIPFEMVHPQKAMTKWTGDLFNKSTGYKGITSEHGRDAALLVFGKTF